MSSLARRDRSFSRSPTRGCRCRLESLICHPDSSDLSSPSLRTRAIICSMTRRTLLGMRVFVPSRSTPTRSQCGTPCHTSCAYCVARAREGWDPSTEPLRAALTQIATLQPLSAAGVVVWIPGNDEAFSTAWRALPEVIDGALDDLDVDGVPLVEDVPPPRYGHERNLYYSPWDDVHFAIVYVAADLVFCGDGGAIQPAFANQLARRIAPRLVELDGARPDERLTRLDQLAALAQDVTTPTVQDIVAVRATSEVFAEWRAALERALAAVDTAADVAAARRIVDAELGLPRLSVEHEVNQSKALTAARGAGAALAWSSLAASTGLLVGAEPVQAGVGLAATGVVEWTRRYVQSLRRRRRGRALLAHYLSFESPAGGSTVRRSRPTWVAQRPMYDSRGTRE